jgi:hypothetical protein
MVNRLKHRISKDGILAFWPALMIDILKGEFAQRQQIIHFPTTWIPKVEGLSLGSTGRIGLPGSQDPATVVKNLFQK